MIFLILIISISLIIIFHELGHFLVAKKSGAIVEEFGLGLPPRIFGKEINGTIYSLNLIPFGAFVKIFGEENNLQEKGSFYNLSLGKRALIIAAGPLFNIFLAFLILVFGFSFIGMPALIFDDLKGEYKIVKEIPGVFVYEVAKDSPAEKVGIKPQDIILKVNNENIKSPDDLSSKIEKIGEKEISITIKRNNKEMDLKITPQRKEDGKAKIGVAILKIGYLKYPVWKSIKIVLNYIVSVFWGIFLIFFELIKRFFNAPEILQTASGPVGIFFLLQNAYYMGINYFLFILAQISLTLGVINLFPFPGLDGFRIIFVGIEKIFKNNKEKVWFWERVLNTIGIFILIILMFFITFSDISKFLRK